MAIDKLKIDQDAFNDTKIAYDECSDQMTTLRDNLKKAVSGLRSGWESEGGEAFFDKFDNSWEKNFNDYIAVIQHMSSDINAANEKYQEVFDEAAKLNLQ